MNKTDFINNDIARINELIAKHRDKIAYFHMQIKTLKKRRAWYEQLRNGKVRKV